MKDPDPACPAIDLRGRPEDGPQPCLGETVKVPSPVSRPLGGSTPLFYRNRGTT